MVSITDSNRSSAGSRAAGDGLVVAVDRADGFRKARRHTQLVKILRLALPLSGAALSVYFVATLMHETGLTTRLPSMPMPRITAQDLTMQNPSYEGTTNEGGTYRVTAARARQDFSNTDIIELEEIAGNLVDQKKSQTRLTATRGTFDHKKSILLLKEKIAIVSDDGMSADLTSATVKTREGLITSTDPVQVGFPAGTVRSQKLTISQKTKRVAFVDQVVAKLKPAARAPASPAAPDAAAAVNQAAPLFSASDAPVDITAARLDIDDSKKIAVFGGNVVASQADAKLQSAKLFVTYENDAAPGASSNPAAGDPAAASGKVKRIDTNGPFVMVRGTTDRVTGNTATFDVPSETALLDGSVVITSTPDRRVTADRAELNQRADTALLTGTVVVENGATVLKGRRLAIDRANGRTSLTAPPMAGSGPGRIAAHFVQNGAKPGAAKKPAKAAASGASGGIANFKTDPDAPLDVDADSLDVDDAQKVAVFRGDVVARQGEVTISAPELQAHYTGSANLADTTDKAPAAAQKSPTELTRIEARPSVKVTTADNRKVTGDWAVYDAKANTVVVGGNVELSQDSSVVRGTRLVIDMATGQSTIDTAPTKTTAKPAGGGWVTEADGRKNQVSSGGRPSAIFFPNELRNSQSGGAKTKKDNGVDGWSARTAPGAD